ncbi:MAG TPA: MFS transporter [Aggregatilineales bacterium]|nr:MFS transporter [Aggregatilineales bacterium]
MFSYFRTHKMDAYRLFLWMAAGNALFSAFVFSVMMVWQVEVVGLTPLQLVLVGTALEVTIFLFEVPTGVVADVYSRRLSLIIGYVIMGVGFLLSGLYATFEATLLGSALWGLGYTFTSGALQAWFTDEVGVDQAGRAFIRSAQLGHIVGIVGALIATALGSLMLNLPMILGGLLYIALAIFLAFVMPEHGFKPAPREERNSFQQMGKTLLEGRRAVRGSTILLAIMGIGLFVGLYSEGYDRLNTAHLLSFELPILGGLQLPSVVWINLLGIIGGLLATAALQVVMNRLQTDHDAALARASFFISVVMVGGLVAFALAGNFVLAVLFQWVIGITRNLIEPLEANWINRQIQSNVRATVISMRGQVDAIGQMAGGPPVGLVGERLGVRAALLTSAAILSPTILCYRLLIRHLRSRADAPKV